MDFTLAPDTVLPEDGYRGMLIGRVWLPTANGLPGGPSVVVYAGPRVQILGGIQQNIGSNNGLFLKLGAEANQLNFGRCDINEVYAVNALSQIGLTHKLSAQSQMTLTLTRAYPLKKIHFTTQEADFRLNTPANALGGHIGFQYFF